MLNELAKGYYLNGYNCAEAMLLAGNEYYNLNLGQDTFKIMAGFGGGVTVEDLCGVVSGSVALLGLMFVENRAHDSAIIKDITTEFVEGFRAKLTSINCAELKSLYREEEKKCSYVVDTGAKVLESIIEKYRS